MPDFAAPRLGSDGDSLALADLRGRPYVLNLWATWCPPCRAETPYLQSLYEDFSPRGLEMVGVTVDNRGALDQARDFLDEAGVTYIQLHDPAMRSMDLLSVLGLPATWVVDAEGVVRFARNGPVMEGDPAFEGAIEEAVEGTP